MSDIDKVADAIIADQQFREWLHGVEDPQNKSLHSDGLYRPHPSAEGGTPTLVGHKLTEAEMRDPRFQAGLSKAEVDELTAKDLREATRMAAKFYGPKGFAALDLRMQQLLVDMAYNLGPKHAEYKKLQAAIRGAASATDPAIKAGYMREARRQSKRNYSAPVLDKDGKPVLDSKGNVVTQKKPTKWRNSETERFFFNETP